MPDVVTTNMVRSLGNQSATAAVRQAFAGSHIYLDMGGGLDANLQAWAFSGYPPSTGEWAIRPLMDVQQEMAMKNALAILQRHLRMRFFASNHPEEWKGYPIRGFCDATAFQLTSDSLASVMRTAGNDMLPELSEAISNLHSYYMFNDGEAVDSFLCDNPFLTSILLNARHNIAERFEDNPSLALEIVSDPEEPGADQLFLFIQTSLPPEQARERLRRLDREWWLAVVPTVRNKLTIDTELV